MAKIREEIRITNSMSGLNGVDNIFYITQT